MRSRLSIIALFFAWLCASGAMLDVAQIVAWGRMFSNYAHAMPVAEAALETLDANKPCALCLALRRTREQSKQEQPAGGTAAAERLVLILHEAEPVMLGREQEPWPAARVALLEVRRDPVPVPPPRQVCSNPAV